MLSKHIHVAFEWKSDTNSALMSENLDKNLIKNLWIG